MRRALEICLVEQALHEFQNLLTSIVPTLKGKQFAYKILWKHATHLNHGTKELNSPLQQMKSFNLGYGIALR